MVAYSLEVPTPLKKNIPYGRIHFQFVPGDIVDKDNKRAEAVQEYLYEIAFQGPPLQDDEEPFASAPKPAAAPAAKSGEQLVPKAVVETDPDATQPAPEDDEDAVQYPLPKGTPEVPHDEKGLEVYIAYASKWVVGCRGTGELVFLPTPKPGFAWALEVRQVDGANRAFIVQMELSTGKAANEVPGHHYLTLQLYRLQAVLFCY